MSRTRNSRAAAPEAPGRRAQTPPRVLTIAGSDSGGGAGIQADLRTMAALGCHGLSAVTAVTAQNSLTVRAVMPVPAAMVRAQCEAVLDDIGAQAVKIGMLATDANVRAVSGVLRRRGVPAVVLDPVLRASSGAGLLDPRAVSLLVRVLFPHAVIVTPNIPEAEAILGRALIGAAALERAARDLLGYGARAVLLKGGHRRGPARDLFTDGVAEIVLEEPRLPARNTHGSGCVLSSALACFLARGLPLLEAVRRAKHFVTEAIRHAYPLGAGPGPVNPAGAVRADGVRGALRW